MAPKRKRECERKYNGPFCHGCEEEKVDEPGDFCELCTSTHVGWCIMCFGQRCPLEKAIAVGCLKRPEETPLCLACWLKHREKGCVRCAVKDDGVSEEVRRKAEAKVDEVLEGLRRMNKN
jgi:hypothetical protein